MTAPAKSPMTRTQTIDCIFAGLVPEAAASGTPPQGEAAPEPAEPPPYAGSTPPPRLENAEDLRAANEWLQAEKVRLEEYTRSQFARIHQQQQALLAKHTQSEHVLAARAQEINREMHFLGAQAEALSRRGQELASREQLLAGQMAELAKAQTELLSIQQTSQNIYRDTEAQRAVLNALRAETAKLQETEAGARGKFETLERELHERKQAWEKKQAELAARLAEVNKRYLALDQAEAAARQRLQELDEYERRLAKEFEDHAEQLAQERRELEALRAKVRPPGVPERARSPFRPAVGGVSLRKYG